jgi:hypothetical protein
MDHRSQRSRIQPLPVDLGAHVAQRVEQRLMGEVDRLVLSGSETVPSGFREASFVQRQKRTADYSQRRDSTAIPYLDLDPSLRLESFRADDDGVTVQVDYGLVTGLDPNRRAR